MNNRELIRGFILFLEDRDVVLRKYDSANILENQRTIMKEVNKEDLNTLLDIYLRENQRE